MISLTRFDGKEFLLSPHLIETIEATPDTVISLTSGHKYVVKEGVEEVRARIVAFYREIYHPTLLGDREDQSK